MPTVRLTHDVKLSDEIFDADGNRLIFTGRQHRTSPVITVDIDLGGFGAVDQSNQLADAIVSALQDLRIYPTPDPADVELLQRQLVVMHRGLEKHHDTWHDGIFRTCQQDPCVDVVRSLQSVLLGQDNGIRVETDLDPHLLVPLSL